MGQYNILRMMTEGAVITGSAAERATWRQGREFEPQVGCTNSLKINKYGIKYSANFKNNEQLKQREELFIEYFFCESFLAFPPPVKYPYFHHLPLYPTFKTLMHFELIFL